jgi:two-component system sensor histidine kinase QseC
MKALANELKQRGADELQPISTVAAPLELYPMLQAMNGLFERIETALQRERRFTADAAHELRTPLAVLSAQWDLLKHCVDDADRHKAMMALRAGIERMGRLVDQLLRLSRLESLQSLPQSAALDWPEIARQAISEVLPIAERRQIQFECLWSDSTAPHPDWRGDTHLMTVLLRNLLDNAARYAPSGSEVILRFGSAHVAVENEGKAIAPQDLARLGERFNRPDGQAEGGSGLGVSIARRIAELHGLSLQYRSLGDGTGLVAELART